ncbi:flagellar hook-basal body protein [Caulifigura coniformis]|uniref:flagellar hook-basal body protein n=1 Tax=Caulifigura coniformis TaxID=2527983 RepID=UPI0018D25FFE|nr:flagellar hook basal-body protein [Caulifigura coniformis]
MRLPDLSIGTPISPDSPEAHLPSLESLTPELRTAFAPEPSTVHAIATAPVETTPAPASPGDPAPIEPPRQLPIMPDAEPLPAELPREDAELRAFIRDELQTLAASEHDVWYETLRGLSRDDATEILRIWKMTRGPDSGAVWPELDQIASAPVPAAVAKVAEKKPPAKPAAPTTSHTPGLTHLSSHQVEVRRVCQHNLANSSTPGFKRRELIVFEHTGRSPKESPDSSAVISLINTSQGKLTTTQRPLDCAIHGNGFFQVKRGEDACLTRCGRFVLDRSRRIALPRSQGEPCPIEPAIVVPVNVERLEILADGEVAGRIEGSRQVLGRIGLVQVVDPSALEPVGDNLFKPTAASGAVSATTPDQRGELMQAHIEESNVDPAEERRRLEALAAQSASL